MNKNRFRQFVTMLAFLALAACGGSWLFGCLSGEPDLVDNAGGGSGQAQKTRFTLPVLPPVFAHMTPAQKKQVIEQAQKDAEAAARASGQPDMQAVEAGQAAAVAAQRAIDRPSGIGGNP